MADMYLCYARSGKEFEVADALTALGADVWCGRKIEWVRTGKKRRPEPKETPALPNYLFARMTPEQFYAALAVKFLARTMAPLSAGSMVGFERFARSVDQRYQADDKMRRNAEIPLSQFQPGELIQIIGGPFADLTGTFRGIVEHAHDIHPRIQMDLGGVPVTLDPLDVRRAS